MLRIATRRSALARAQAHQLGALLAERSGRPFELVPMATSGDLQPTRAVNDFDLKGLFVDTIRQAVLSGDCDLAVHSYKDLPTAPADGLTVAAVPERADPRDVLITRAPVALAALRAGARVGTSSERRRLQLLQARPDLGVVAVRGNLDTRLGKVAHGELDAVVVALAGLSRLYVPESQGGVGALDLDLHAAPLEPGQCLPAPAQGALAVEARSDDPDVLAACRLVADGATERCVRAERAFLAAFGGGCLAPVGALGTVAARGGQLQLRGMMGDPLSGRVLHHATRTAASTEPEAAGRQLAADMLARGGGELLDGIERARGQADRGGRTA